MSHLLARPRRLLSLVIFALTTSTAASFGWRQADAARYAFAAFRPPLEMGDVADRLPASLQHNTYVHLQGITEHRGLEHRASTPWRPKLWLFRLVGSRGIFINVPAHSPGFAPTTEVDVVGRVVDPEHDRAAAARLAHYNASFGAPARPQARLIEVNVHPGGGRAAYLCWGGLIIGLLGAYAWVLWRWLQQPGP